MKEPREDDERLSALLEGRVEGRQRDDLLAHLSAADDDYEVFTDTAAVLRALEDEDARVRRPARTPSMARGGWRAPSLRTAVAVTGTMVLLLALGLALQGRATAARGPLQLALLADPDTQGLGDLAPWTPRSPMRGAGGRAARDARAVRAGAMLLDLAVAARAGDTAQTRRVAERLIGQFDPGASPDTPLRRIEARPHEPADTLGALVQGATERLVKFLERKPLELGAWAEAARLAAHARNAGFFEDGRSRGMLNRAKRLARGDAGARAAVERVRAYLPAANEAPRWGELATSLDALLHELGG